ncbi:hypothetical protein D3C78_1698290 [compost metagenome]
MVERRGVHGGLLVRVHGLHDVDFDFHRATAHGEDVLIDVFTFALEGAGLLQAQHVDP